MGKSGIYVIENLANGHRYVGSSADLRKRRLGHFSQLRQGAHHSRHLQNAFNKYGEKSFSFSVLFYCDPNMLTLFEQRTIDVLRPEYNIAPRANSSLGVKHDAEFRAGARRKRGPKSAEAKSAQSKTMISKWADESWRTSNLKTRNDRRQRVAELVLNGYDVTCLYAYDMSAAIQRAQRLSDTNSCSVVVARFGKNKHKFVAYLENQASDMCDLEILARVNEWGEVDRTW